MSPHTTDTILAALLFVTFLFCAVVLATLPGCCVRTSQREYRVLWTEETKRAGDGTVTTTSGPDSKVGGVASQLIAATVSLYTGSVIPTAVASCSGAVEPLATGMAQTISAPARVADNLTTTGAH